LPKVRVETVVFELFKQDDVINIIPVIAEEERSGQRHVNPRKSQIRNSTPDSEWLSHSGLSMNMQGFPHSFLQLFTKVKQHLHAPSGPPLLNPRYNCIDTILSLASRYVMSVTFCSTVGVSEQKDH